MAVDVVPAAVTSRAPLEDRVRPREPSLWFFSAVMTELKKCLESLCRAMA